MVTYALIHGAHHGAWCWDFLRPELVARGHRSVAVDLPIEDPTADVSAYAKVTVDALSKVDEDVVVVGHSLGGIVAPVVAAHRPTSRLVYLSAWVPQPGRSLADQQRDEPDSGYGGVKIDNGDGTWRRPAAEANRVYYQDCPAERRQYALARLRRQSRAPHEEVSPLAAQPTVSTTLSSAPTTGPTHPTDSVAWPAGLPPRHARSPARTARS
jgi:pimeloyl-ACP methyl ester carboxylesterase